MTENIETISIDEEDKEEEEKITLRNIKKMFNEMLFDMFSEERERTKDAVYSIAYKKIIDKTASFLKDELKVNDPIRESIIFEYLLWNGYFSKDKSYQFSMGNVIGVISCLGADIMRGNGTCLNNAHMLSDVLNKSGYKSYPTICYCDVPKLIGRKKNEYPPIKRKYDENNDVFEDDLKHDYKFLYIALKPTARMIGNHVIVSIKYDNKIFGADPTNLCFIDYKNRKIDKGINVNVNFKLKPLSTRVINSDKENETGIIFEYKKNTPRRTTPFIDKELLIKKYIEEVNYCDSKKELLDEFHKDCEEEIDVIYNTYTRENTLSPEEKEVLDKYHKKQIEEYNEGCKKLTKKIR